MIVKQPVADIAAIMVCCASHTDEISGVERARIDIYLAQFFYTDTVFSIYMSPDETSGVSVLAPNPYTEGQPQLNLTRSVALLLTECMPLRDIEVPDPIPLEGAEAVPGRVQRARSAHFDRVAAEEHQQLVRLEEFIGNRLPGFYATASFTNPSDLAILAIEALAEDAPRVLAMEAPDGSQTSFLEGSEDEQ